MKPIKTTIPLVIVGTVLIPFILFGMMIVSLNGIILLVYVVGFISITVVSAFLIFPILMVSVGCAISVILLGIISNVTFKASRTIFLGTRNFLFQILNKVKLRSGKKKHNDHIIEVNISSEEVG